MNKPNILWICTDQQRFDTIEALGNEHIRTPHLNALVQQGVSFTRTYCQSPICTPSRASFLTGLYPSSIHVTRNGNDYFPRDQDLISKRLADDGYRCGLVGKLHLAGAFTGREKIGDAGYDSIQYSHGPIRGLPCTGTEYGNDYLLWLQEQEVDLDDVFIKNKKGQYYAYNPAVDVKHHQTTWCVDKSIEFITESQDAPWLLHINMFDPHPPYDAPEAYTRRCLERGVKDPYFRDSDLEPNPVLKSVYHQTRDPKRPDQQLVDERAAYYGMVELIDEQLGRLFEVLETSGQKDNTIVIFMSDHGEMLGDHGLTHKGCRFYEGAVHVPLIISWPSQFKMGETYEGLVELTDIVPTLADIVEMPLEQTHGFSLLPILKGDQDHTPRQYVRCEYYNTLTEAAGEPLTKPSYGTMYYDGRYKLVNYHHVDYGELYDHTNDPHEYDNLWEHLDYQDIKLKLLKRSFDASTIIADPGPPKTLPF